MNPKPENMKAKTIRRIIFWALGVLVVVLATIFSIGYFYYGKILKNLVITTIDRDSKGLYKAEIGSIYLNLLAGDLTIRNFKITPDTGLYHARSASDTLSPLLIGIKIDRFRISGFKVMDAVKLRRIDVKKILFTRPEITVFRMKMAEKSDKPGKKKDLMTSIPLPKGWNSIEVGNFAIVDASVEFIDCSRDSVTRNLFPVCNIDVKHILVDSAHQGKIRLYNSDDIRITIGAYSLNSKNGMNRISFGGVGLSTADGEVWVRNFHLEPLFNNHDYSRKLGYQTDRMDVRVSEMRFKRMDLRSLLFQGKLQAGLLLIDSLLIDDYRDKRVASRPGFRPPMPQDAIRKLTTCLKIDTVQLKYGKAAYAEQTGDVPGTLFFDTLHGFEVSPGSIGFGGGSQIQCGFDDWINSFG